MKILLTGGTGFFGSILKSHLQTAGHDYVNLDRLNDPQDAASGKMALVDLRDAGAVEAACQKFGPFDAVCHVAAELAHEAQDKQGLWNSNVEGTRNVAEACRQHGVKKLIFTSTNCLWGKPLNRPVVENDETCPVEVYGKVKTGRRTIAARCTGRPSTSSIFHQFLRPSSLRAGSDCSASSLIFFAERPAACAVGGRKK